MKKTNYNIQGKFGNEPFITALPGYIFYYGGNRYGVTNYYKCPNGKVEKSNYWSISELTTGYSVVPCKRTRKEAIDELINRRLTDGIKKAVKMYLDNGGKDANPSLIPDNEFLTVHPSFCG